MALRRGSAMAHIFNYAVLMAIPDTRRGERVNIGIIVFLRDRTDVRFSELRKIRALRGGNWERYVADVQRSISSNYDGEVDPRRFLSGFSMLEGIIQCSELAWFSIERPEEYETQVREILSALVQRPRAERITVPSTRINTEITRAFRLSRVLARGDEPIDQGMVVRNVPISVEDDLTADFGLRNGVYHIAATLDLRRANVDKGHAAIKAITLHRASDSFDGEVRKIGVYAAPHDAIQFRPHIHMLGEYADDTYNWADPTQREKFLHSIYDAMRRPGMFGAISN
jgi:hypothetical protein